jgi:hypothetical protein
MGDLSICKSTWTLTRIYTVNNLSKCFFDDISVRHGYPWVPTDQAHGRSILPVEEILTVHPHWLRHLPRYLSFLPPEVYNLNWNVVNLNGRYDYFSLLRNFLAMYYILAGYEMCSLSFKIFTIFSNRFKFCLNGSCMIDVFLSRFILTTKKRDYIKSALEFLFFIVVYLWWLFPTVKIPTK